VQSPCTTGRGARSSPDKPRSASATSTRWPSVGSSPPGARRGFTASSSRCAPTEACRSPLWDPRGHAAAWRQQEAQVADKNAQRELQKVICDEYGYLGYRVVQHCDRPLRYPSDYPRQPAQEKGVDVHLAVDFVSGAFAGRFDVGVVMSTDTDLYPALEAVRRHGIDRAWPFALPPEMSLHDDAMDDYVKAAELEDRATRPACEVAAWGTPRGDYPCLRLPRGGKRPTTAAIEKETGKVVPFQDPPEPRMWCHWLDRRDYDAVADLTDYSEGEPPPSSR